MTNQLKAKVMQAASPPTPVSTTGVSIKAIALRELAYRELDRPDNFMPDAAPETVATDMKASFTINIFVGQLAEYILDLVLTPDPRYRPLEIRVRIGALVHAPTFDDDMLRDWLMQFGSLIVFPYAREVIHSTTGRGIFGPVLLDPIPIDNLTRGAVTQ